VTTALAAGLWALMVALIAATAAMKLSGWKGSGNTDTAVNVALVLAFLAFATMGALVAARVPRNAIGWLFLAIALLAALSAFTEDYAFHAAVEKPGSLPLGVLVAWVYSWSWYPTVILLLFVPLLYPTGMVPGPRWRPLLAAEIAVVAVVTVLYMLDPGPLDGERKLPVNPIGVGPLRQVIDNLGPVLGLTAVAFLGLGIASLVVRFRRSRDVERQQIKIMAFAAALVLAGVIATFRSSSWTDLVFAVTVLLFPTAVGIAMLRYRLYDVDRVINKTLVYGVLTAVLAAAYAALVLGGQALFSSVAGGSNLAIATSTLLVAAAFMPLRRRIQAFVDRRFYRSRYDAGRTLERFAARLRQEVDLDVLNGDLLAVVRETMEPAHASVWLRTSRGLPRSSGNGTDTGNAERPRSAASR
jgi:hypothetical protein